MFTVETDINILIFLKLRIVIISQSLSQHLGYFRYEGSRHERKPSHSHTEKKRDNIHGNFDN